MTDSTLTEAEKTALAMLRSGSSFLDAGTLTKVKLGRLGALWAEEMARKDAAHVTDGETE